MVPLLVLLTIVGFILADWIQQVLQARRERVKGSAAPDARGMEREVAGWGPEAS